MSYDYLSELVRRSQYDFDSKASVLTCRTTR